MGRRQLGRPAPPGLVFVTPRWVRRGPSWYFVDGAGGSMARPGRRPGVPHAGIAVGWGRPSYFVHTWRRYPMVHRYYGSWRAPLRTVRITAAATATTTRARP